MRSFTPFALLSTLSLLTGHLVQAATICNGYSDLCTRSYSNVTFLGAHDSYAVGTSIADNQDKDVTSQLNDGIRTLQIQTHNATDAIHVCHTSCSLIDGGTLESYLAKVASWLGSNPNDVITIVMVNIDDLPATSFESAFSSSGLQNYTYTPSESTIALNSWPTLGDLIDAGTRAIVFMDQEADFATVPWIIDEFSNMWEDAYDVTDSTWGCAVNRTTGSAGSQLMLVNHFLDSVYTVAGTTLFVPDKASLNVTNAASGTGSIGTHVDNCYAIWGRNPNHILLDYYDSNGNAPFDLVASLNSVSAPTNTVTAGTASATGSSATAVVSSSSLSSAAQRFGPIDSITGLGLAMTLGLGVGVARILL